MNHNNKRDKRRVAARHKPEDHGTNRFRASNQFGFDPGYETLRVQFSLRRGHPPPPPRDLQNMSKLGNEAGSRGRSGAFNGESMTTVVSNAVKPSVRSEVRLPLQTNRRAESS